MTETVARPKRPNYGIDALRRSATSSSGASPPSCWPWSRTSSTGG